jgi:uroporphyrinogen decarboxylase
MMNSRDRTFASFAGAPVDRPPLILWRHFPVADQDPMSFARATMDFQHRFDFDLIKVTPSSSYCLYDWNARDEWRGNPEGTREYTQHIISSPDDWLKLKPLNPKKGFLGKTLDALKMIREKNDTSAPIIQTIFNPLAQAKNLAGKENLAVHMRRYPDALKMGLETITTSIMDYLQSLAEIGVDGIFYAVQHAQYSLLSELEFQSFSRVYDLRILNSNRHFPARVLHIHGANIMFEQVKDYPVNLFNWHDRESEYSLSMGKQLTNAAVCGGIKRETMELGSPDQVSAEIKQTLEETGGVSVCLGTGCVIQVTTPEENIYTARKVMDSVIK